MIKVFLIISLAFLAISCSKTGSNVLQVYNDGFQGYTSAGLISKEPYLLSQQPKLVILMIGSNDVINSQELSGFSENIVQIINTVKKAGSKIILMTPPAMDSVIHYAANIKLDSLCVVIKNLSVNNRCYFFDVNGLYKRNNYEKRGLLLYDGLHPDSSGYKLLGDSLYAYLKQQKLTTVKTIGCFGDSITYGQSVTGEGTSTGATYPGLLKALLISNDQ